MSGEREKSKESAGGRLLLTIGLCAVAHPLGLSIASHCCSVIPLFACLPPIVYFAPTAALHRPPSPVYSDQVTIMSGTSTSCVNTTASAAAGGASSTAAGASSAVSSAAGGASSVSRPLFRFGRHIWKRWEATR